MSAVLLGLGGGRGRGRETEQGAEASRCGLRGPKLMGGYCGYCVVKDTCKHIKQKWKEEEGQRVDEGRESRSKWRGQRKGGGQREKRGLSQVVQSAKQDFNKHTKSKQSQTTVTEPAWILSTPNSCWGSSVK